jgi:hypothetical protein
VRPRDVRRFGSRPSPRTAGALFPKQRFRPGPVETLRARPHLDCLRADPVAEPVDPLHPKHRYHAPVAKVLLATQRVPAAPTRSVNDPDR